MTRCSSITSTMTAQIMQAPSSMLQIVVGFVMLAFNPLSRASIAKILEITSEDVGIALCSLHSVFIVPESKWQRVRICHKSLADYLTDVIRCTDLMFYINPSISHLELGARCLRSMSASLKRDIYGLS
jgi:hypothetical protein